VSFESHKNELSYIMKPSLFAFSSNKCISVFTRAYAHIHELYKW